MPNRWRQKPRIDVAIRRKRGRLWRRARLKGKASRENGDDSLRATMRHHGVGCGAPDDVGRRLGERKRASFAYAIRNASLSHPLFVDIAPADTLTTAGSGDPCRCPQAPAFSCDMLEQSRMAGCVLFPESESLSSWISGEAGTARPVRSGLLLMAKLSLGEQDAFGRARPIP